MFYQALKLHSLVWKLPSNTYSNLVGDVQIMNLSMIVWKRTSDLLVGEDQGLEVTQAWKIQKLMQKP